MKLRKKITIGILWTLIVASFVSPFSTIIGSADPVNQPPVFGTPSPGNSSTGIWWNPPPYGAWIPWNIPINDPEGDRLSWTIQCSNGQSASGTNAFNGSFYVALSSISYSTTYKVWVNTTDPLGSGLYTRGWFTFTTKTDNSNPPSLLRAPSPANGSTGVSLSRTWSIRINDLEGNLFTWSLKCSNGQSNSSSDASNGTKSLSLSGLAYSTTYKVWVNATDPSPPGSGLYTRKWYTFTTKANEPPVFSTPTLPNESVGNGLSFSWQIPISDPDGNTFNWRIECSNGQFSYANNAGSGTKSLSLSGLTQSTTYTIWVNATDSNPPGSGLWTRSWFTFTTADAGGNTPPAYETPSPTNSSSGNRLYFPWAITINDPEGTVFSWTIHCSNGQTSSGTRASNGTKSLFVSGLAYSTTYKVWVNATDITGSNQYTRKWYTFTTEAIYPVSIPTSKSWSPITSLTGESRVGPNIADINNDGRMEIIRSGQNGIVAYDGITGAITWSNITAMWDSHNPLEITDLNNDGYLEVISSYNTGTRALKGQDGTQLWYTSNAPLYNKHPVVGDVNGDGFPEVFVCAAGAEDGSPRGKLTALNHNGGVIDTEQIYFPCYGGLSLGDTNFDGVYEVYLCERNIGYDGNVVGRGVAAYWASNLTYRWSHPEMLSSSHCPTLVDTNKDGILDVVVLNQNGALAIYNAADGSVIHYSTIPGVRFHSQPTIYDLDNDGNLEIIAGGASDNWGKVVIWDLYTWSLETWLPFNCWEPPAIADLNGDGRVEILECTISNISIFDDNYVLRGSIPLDNNRSGDGWYGMSMIIAQDIDNDGLIELVLNRNTRIYAYETTGGAPTPRATSQYMYYSPLRGRYPYSSPYPAMGPSVINEYPANTSTNIPLNPQLSVYIYDNQQDTMNITFRTNASTGVWHNLKTYTNVQAGTYTNATLHMDSAQTYYWWGVTVTDSTGMTTNKIYKFRTITGGPQLPPDTPSDPFPVNGSIGNSVTTDLSWTGGDPNGDPVTYVVYLGTTNPPPLIVNNQSALSYNPPSNLELNTTYYWKIVAWDNRTASTPGPLWEFTTGSQVNTPPNTPNTPSPPNGATNKAITTKLSWSGGDPDGNPVTYDVYFGTNTTPSKVVSNQTALTYNPGTLAYVTTYYWKIVAWDDQGASASSTTWDPWNFTTKSYSSSQPPSGGGSTEDINVKPNADASAGEPYHGTINTAILFDGSRSSDSDGNITQWLWNFGDHTNATGVAILHTYSTVGTYSVTLTVTDDKGDTDTDTTTCVITQPNRAPTKPIITGPTTGTKNTNYAYSALSTDADNDTIQYTFDWADSSSTPSSSGFIQSGETYSINHTWVTAGRFTIRITASDNQSTSSSDLTVYIDAKPIGDVGYLVDNNSDGTYDAFYSDTTKRMTAVQEKNGNYSIDTNGDGTWDLTYDSITGLSAPIETPEKQTPGFEIVLILGAIAFVLLLQRKKRQRT